MTKKVGQKEEKVWRDLRYRRWVDDEHGAPRGTVEIMGRRIYGYPRIGRVLNLHVGLREQFQSAFWVEEKVDGYNVRIACIDGKPLAFTRGGFLCPFTTDRLADLLPGGVFDRHPDLVLCAEVAGPETPYCEASPPYIKEDVRLFLFDMMRLNQPHFLPQEETYAIADELRIPTVERCGRFTLDEIEQVCAILDRMDREGKEGAVFKAVEVPSKRVKYTTAHASLEDISVAAPNLVDFPPHYYIGRILRLALFLDEQGRSPSHIFNEELGAAFLEGLIGSIKQVHSERRVYHRYSCRFHEKEAAQEMLEHLKQVSGKSLRIRFQSLEKEGGYWRLTFDREPPSMNGLLHHLLKGGTLFD